MRRVLAFWAIGLSVLAACGGGGGGGGGDTATAINGPYENNFDGASPLDGWMFYDPNDPNTPPSASVSTLWAADATPADMPGGAFSSFPSSLNYNNGTNYDVGTNAGVAISPKVNIANMSLPVVYFKCNYETETDGTQYDQRHVRVGYLDNSGQPQYYYQEQLSTTPGAETAGPCSASGTWHEHIIALDPSWGEIRVAFGFDSIDGYSNTYRGWFVDDFMIIEATEVPVPGDGSGAGTGGDTSGGGGGDTSGGGGDTSGGTGGDTTGGGGDTTGGGTTGGGNTSGGGSTTSGTIYSTNFDSPAAVSGWTLGGTDVKWLNDETPTTFPGGSYTSAPNSLNYNDGTDYDNGIANSGVASSPAINLAGYTNPVLKFQCNFETEDMVSYDIRRVRIKSQGVTVPVLDAQLLTLNGSPLLGDCAASGTWHEHAIVLDPAWGTITIEFFFDTVDAWTNNKAGWAVDDLSVTGTPASSGGGMGGGAVGGSVESQPEEHEGDNGDSGINDSCSGSISSRAMGFAWILAALAALAIVRRSR